MILVKGNQLEASHFAFTRLSTATDSGPTAVASGSAAGVADGSARPLGERLQDEEKREIIAAVEKSNNKIAGAARILGINRSTLYYRMRKLGLDHLLPTKVGVGGRESGDESSEDSST